MSESLYDRSIRRIEELENQLREAENYIRDLQDDLAESRDELKVALRFKPPAAPSDEKDSDTEGGHPFDA